MIQRAITPRMFHRPRLTRGIKYDYYRTRYIESLGDRVSRVTHNEVLEDVESLVHRIAKSAGVDLHAW